MRLIHRLEPLLWLLFGAGGFAAALILPGFVIGLLLLAPLGVFDESAISYHRMRALAANPAGRVILAAVISLVLWHAAHHLRHLALDLGLRSIETSVCYVLYGLALAGTIASISAVASL